jgi:hypothetical protein
MNSHLDTTVEKTEKYVFMTRQIELIPEKKSATYNMIIPANLV